MSPTITTKDIVAAISVAAGSLNDRREEVNRLNVFPVPDGDTGTNMSLTVKSVVDNVAALPAGFGREELRRAITTGALMGARGNSGVITSQILRGLCEGAATCDTFDTAAIDTAFAHAMDVAFKAVRKPVRGTILTVLEDSAAAAKFAHKKKMDTEEAMEHVVAAAYESVQRTPEFLPVLKENGVVDAGGFGLAILLDAFVSGLTGKKAAGTDVTISSQAAPKVEIEQINDWEGSRFRYCNEFLVDSDTLVVEEALEFLATMGDCELCVGSTPKFKVHVHSNTPDKVLAYFLERGQISEVFIHNMQLQSAERNDKLAAEEPARKPLGVVAVAAGAGNAAILRNLGVDVVVEGGQTMNPSTRDLMDAAKAANADEVIILPNNSNIIMAANSAVELLEFPCGVVPTKSVPAAFSALFGYVPEDTLQENLASMEAACAQVKYGEVTTAIKDSRDAYGNPIAAGDVIGIADGSILTVGSSVDSVVIELLRTMGAQDCDMLTILRGEDMDEADFDALVGSIEEDFDELDVDPHDGGQPLYPIIFSLE